MYILGVPFFQESVNRDDHNLRIERFTSIGGQDQQQAVKRLNQVSFVSRRPTTLNPSLGR